MSTKYKHRNEKVTSKVVYDTPNEDSGLTESTGVTSRSMKGDVERKSVKPNGSRPSRVVAAVLGLGTLAAAIIGVLLFMDKKEFSLRRPSRLQHPNYQGQVTYDSMALHDVPEDCWMEIHGKVYDLTEYAPDHPGGPEYVTDYCGMEATRAFDMEHTTSMLSMIRKYNLGEAVTALSTNEGGANMDPGTASSDSSDGEREDSSDDNGDKDLYVDPDGRSPTTTTTSAPPNNNAVIATTPATAPGNSVDIIPTTAATTTTTKPEGCPVQYYSTSTVSQHNSRFDCWYILYDTVWDFTSYVDVHPGGARRLFKYCGTDATIPYTQEKKHDQSLLAKKTPNLLIGKLGSTTELRYEPC